jgi:hypothetical protein
MDVAAALGALRLPTRISNMIKRIKAGSLKTGRCNLALVNDILNRPPFD